MSSNSQLVPGSQEVMVTETRIVLAEVGNNGIQICSSGLVYFICRQYLKLMGLDEILLVRSQQPRPNLSLAQELDCTLFKWLKKKSNES